MSDAFAKQSLPANSAVAVVTNAGGCGILAADALEKSNSLHLATFSPQVLRRLESTLPTAASKNNPVDVLGDALAVRYGEAVDATLSDEGVGSVLVILTPQAPTQPVETAKLLDTLSKKHGKPIFASFMGEASLVEAKAALLTRSIPNFDEPERAVVAMDAMVSYRNWLDAEPDEVDEKLDMIDTKLAQEVIARIRESGTLATGGFEARDVLKAFGIPMPPAMVVQTAEDAVKAAEEIGFPCVLKIASPKILHKSAVGGVALNLKTAEQVHDSFELMMIRAANKRPDAHLHGCQVLPMVKGGREVIVGINRDKQFGPLIMFGLGGTMVEGMKDVTFRVAPLTKKDATDMIRSGTSI